MLLCDRSINLLEKHKHPQGLYSHVIKRSVSATAAVKGKKGRTPSNRLLQEPRGGSVVSSDSCLASPSAFVGGLSEWVGSAAAPSPSRDKDMTQISNNPLSLFLCFLLKLLLIV